MEQKAIDIHEELGRCSHCGSCLSVCPVYRETAEEGMSARGKVSLIEAHELGGLSFSRKFQGLIESCLLCGACVAQCASGVHVDKLVQWQRLKLRQGGHRSLKSDVAVSTLEAAGRWPRLMGQAGSLAQALLCKRIPAESGLHLRLPLAALSGRGYVPKLSVPPFLSGVPQHVPGSGPRVGLFVGCVGNYLFPEISRASVDLLRRAGFEVIVPAEQRCCGMAAWASGDLETATALARHNSRVFREAGCRWVVSACGTCSTQLRRRMPELLTDSAPDAARFLSENATDLVAFIAGELSPAQLRRVLTSPGPLRLSYHDPCHLLYHQGIFREPRQLLAVLPEITVAELPGSHQCCGHGGLFNVGNHGLSTAISDRKMHQVERAAPEVLTTGCMGCLLQLQEGNWRHGLGLRVCHLVEVLSGRGAG
jgi:glycolate oxidase iron-sulfur subunit